MGVDISEKLKMVFFQKWNHSDFRMIALENALERVNKEKGKSDPDLALEYADKIADEMTAGLASCLELLGKFNVVLFKLGCLDSMSISDAEIHDLHHGLCDLTASHIIDYCPVLTATIKSTGRGSLWLGTMGTYILMNGLTIDDANDNLVYNDPDRFVSDLAKKFCCAIEYVAQSELSNASREVFMFDGSKVLEENTTYKWVGEDDDMQVIPENEDFMKKSFEDVIIENYPQTVINIDINHVVNI